MKITKKKNNKIKSPIFCGFYKGKPCITQPGHTKPRQPTVYFLSNQHVFGNVCKTCFDFEVNNSPFVLRSDAEIEINYNSSNFFVQLQKESVVKISLPKCFKIPREVTHS